MHTETIDTQAAPKVDLPVELTGPICAIEIICYARKGTVNNDFIWSKLYSAQKYLTKQIEAYFQPEVA